MEKGYKTILDLRETKEVLETQPAFMEEVTKRGLRYMILPIGLKRSIRSMSPVLIDELAQNDSRPLYFCDAMAPEPESCGTSAG